MREDLTAKEMLSKWDAGETLWTVEMGGLGPGYEQAIHIFCFDIIRELIDVKLPDNNADINKLFDDASMKAAKGKGYSGAQAGAAKNLAFRFLRDGSKKTLMNVPEDRLIQVEKNFPNGDV